MNSYKTSITTGLAHLSYGVAVKDKNHFSSPFAFDAYDMWFGADFDHIINNMMENLWDDIESDIASVDSTNLSEQHSADMSAQSSADRAARIEAGLTSDKTSLTSNNINPALREASYQSTPSSENSGDSSVDEPSSSQTSDNEETTTLDHAHSHY